MSSLDKTLYVVSGFMRTGTSMMMHALDIGGLDAVKRKSRDKMKNRYKDEHYDPNLGGLYELEPKDYKSISFPHPFAGKLIKVLNYGVPRMAVMRNGIRVVFMMRDPEEIRQSYLAFFNKELANLKERYHKNMLDIQDRIKNRKDVLSLTVFQYRDVIDYPLQCFQELRTIGWLIDIKNAASVVNPELCHYRKENLTIGIV